MIIFQEIEYKDGGVFKGQVKMKKKQKQASVVRVTGFGELTMPDGTVFKGAFLKGKPHGFGEKHWPATDGKVYKGKFGESLSFKSFKEQFEC